MISCTKRICFECDYNEYGSYKECPEYIPWGDYDGSVCSHYSDGECCNPKMKELAVDETGISSLERKIKFQELQIRAHLNLIESIRNILQVPAGESILNAIKPVVKKEIPKSLKRKSKAVSTEDRDYLKNILGYYNIEFCPKESTRRLVKLLDKNSDLINPESAHWDFLQKMIDSVF